MKQSAPLRMVVVALVVATIVAGYFIVRRDQGPTVRYGISTTNSILGDEPILPASGGWPHSQLVARDWGLTDELNLKVELVPRVAGRGALATLLDGNADYAIVAATPIVTALNRGDQILVLAQTDRSYRQMRLVTRADHVDDWYEHSIALMPGTAQQSALIAELDHAGQLARLLDGTLETVGLPTTDSNVTALVDRTAASAVLLQPQAELLTRPTAEQPVPDFVDITTPDLYQFTTYMVTTPERWQANHDAIVLAMKATRMSRDLIHEQPELRLRDIHNFEAGQTRLRDDPPLFWNEDEIVFETSDAAVEGALASEAQLLTNAGLIETAPDLKPALTVLAEIEAAT